MSWSGALLFGWGPYFIRCEDSRGLFHEPQKKRAKTLLSLLFCFCFFFKKNLMFLKIRSILFPKWASGDNKKKNASPTRISCTQKRHPFSISQWESGKVLIFSIIPAPLAHLMRGVLCWPVVLAMVQGSVLHSISQIPLQFPVEFFPLFISFYLLFIFCFFVFLKLLKFLFQPESASWLFIRAVCHPEVACFSDRDVNILSFVCSSSIWMRRTCD